MLLDEPRCCAAFLSKATRTDGRSAFAWVFCFFAGGSGVQGLGVQGRVCWQHALERSSPGEGPP